MTIQLHSLRFTVNRNVVSSLHDHGIVLLHIANGCLFASNATGARIWRGVEERQPLEAIVNEISDEYEIDRPKALEHVECFLHELKQQKLIEPEMGS